MERCRKDRMRKEMGADRACPHETDRDTLHRWKRSNSQFLLFALILAQHTENHGNSIFTHSVCVCVSLSLANEWTRAPNTEQVYYYGFVTTATIVIDGNVLSGWISFLFSTFFFILHIIFIHSLVIITSKKPSTCSDSWFFGIIIVAPFVSSLFENRKIKCKPFMYITHRFDGKIKPDDEQWQRMKRETVHVKESEKMREKKR